MMEQIVFYLFAFIIIASALAVVTAKNIFHCALFLILCLFSVAGIYVLLHAEFIAVVQVLLYVGAVAILMIFAIMLTSRLAESETIMTNEQTFIGGFLSLFLIFGLVFTLTGTAFPTQSRFMKDKSGGPVPNASDYLVDSADADSQMAATGLSTDGFPFFFQFMITASGAVEEVRMMNPSGYKEQNEAAAAAVKDFKFDLDKIPPDKVDGWFYFKYPEKQFANSSFKIGTRLMQAFVLPFELVSVLLLAALIGAIVIARREET